ncbi:unnamed protein product [Timema podura]|uniref:Uncharacterized protein n=1 Tax=Timema podura TaxID=61482 RepID=A0ABN7PMT6_TIMPD|nr:unnamed protein product [Timema podura]
MFDGSRDKAFQGSAGIITTLEIYHCWYTGRSAAILTGFQTVSRKTLASIDTLGSILAHRLSEGESPTIIDTGNMNMYIKSDQPTALVGEILGVEEKDQVGVKISKELAQELESKHSQINVQVTVSKDNMFAWYDSGSDMNTEMMMVDIKDPEWAGEVVALDSTTEFLDIFLRIQPEKVVMVKGEASAPAGVTNPGLLEDHIAVHRLTTNKGDSLYIEFDKLNGKLQVRVTRPAGQRIL